MVALLLVFFFPHSTLVSSCLPHDVPRAGSLIPYSNLGVNCAGAAASEEQEGGLVFGLVKWREMGS